MTSHGLKFYKEGLKKPTINFEIPKDSEAIKKFEKILNLKKNNIPKKNFENLAPSYKKQYLKWIASAKLQETKDKRIKKTIENLKENKKPWL